MNKPIRAMSDKQSKRWSKTEPTKGGEKTTTVREIKNGFIINEEVYSDKEGFSCEEYYSKENPLKEMEPISALLSILKNMS